jgi:hypothetical protein
LIVACTSPIHLLYWLGTCVWISYQTVRGALLCSCRLFAPHFSAINSLQECSSLFDELKGSAAFAGYMAGRHLHLFPTSFWDCFHFFYHIQQPCYYEGLLFDVEEFSTAAVAVLKVCSSEYSQTHTLRRLNTFGQHHTW